MGAHARLIVLWGANLASQPNTGSAPGRRPPPRRPRRHDRRAPDRGRGAVRRGDPDPARDRRRARPGDDVGHRRGGASRRGVRGPPHRRLRRARRARPRPRPRVGGAHHRGARRPHRRPRPPLRDDAPRDGPARRELDAQGRPRAGRARRAIGCLPALTGHLGVPGGGLGPRHGAASHGQALVDITRARAAAAGRLRAEPDATCHGSARRGPRPRAPPLRDGHAVLVCGRGACGDRASRGRISW